jgi:hypothetical protein
VPFGSVIPVVGTERLLVSDGDGVDLLGHCVFSENGVSKLGNGPIAAGERSSPKSCDVRP